MTSRRAAVRSALFASLLLACGTGHTAGDGGAPVDAGGAAPADAGTPLGDAAAVPVAARCVMRAADPAGLWIELDHDASGRLIRAEGGRFGPDGPREHAELLAWDAGGRLTHFRIWREDGAHLAREVRRTYAADGRPLDSSSEGAERVEQTRWRYDAAGRLEAVERTLGGSRWWLVRVEVDPTARRATLSHEDPAALSRRPEETIEWNEDGTLRRLELRDSVECVAFDLERGPSGELVVERASACGASEVRAEWRHEWSEPEPGVVRQTVRETTGSLGELSARNEWSDGATRLRATTARAPRDLDAADGYVDYVGCGLAPDRRAPMFVSFDEESFRLAGVPLTAPHDRRLGEVALLVD